MLKHKKIIFSLFPVLFVVLSAIVFNINVKANNTYWFSLDDNISNYMSSDCNYNTVNYSYWMGLGYGNLCPFDDYNTPSQAVASYIGYFDDIKNDDIITNSQYEGTNNIGVTNNLKSYLLNYLPAFPIPDNNYIMGSEPNHPSYGFNQYLIDNNKESLSCDISWSTISTYSDAQSVIDNGRPFIVYAAGNTLGAYRFASGICFGYSVIGNNNYLLIHTLGIDAYNNVVKGFINASYFFKGYYITNRFSSLDHIATAVPIVGAPSTGHTVYCTNCNHYSYNEGHTYVPFGMTKLRCTRCNYTTTNTGHDPIISSFDGGE